MAYASDKAPLELTALTTLASDDTIIVGDTSDASEVAKSITKANLVTDLSSDFATAAQGATADSATQPGDAITSLSGDLPFTQIEQIATNRILGRSTAGTGDVEALTAVQAADTIGVGTGDSPQFTGVNIGHATDTTISRVSAGVIAVEGTNVQLEPAEGGFVDGDKTKLVGIEASADVTDTTNVTAAGALMDSEVTNLAQVKAFSSADYATAAQGSTADSAVQPAVGENLTDVQELRLDGTPDTDHSATGPTTNTFNAGATIAAGEVVYMHTDGEWALADASVTATAEKLIGIALEAGTDTNPLLVALPGSFVRDDTWAWTAGDTLYLSLTAGDLSATVTAVATDEVSRIIGYAVSADVIYLQPQQGVVHV